MPKLPECNHCLLYSHNPHLVCAVHPYGVDDSCLDFRLDPNAEPEELWEPEGASYYDGELILQPKQHLTTEEKLQLLDTHPMFTGCCPSCDYQFPSHIPELVHFDCPRCGWIDDSV